MKGGRESRGGFVVSRGPEKLEALRPCLGLIRPDSAGCKLVSDEAFVGAENFSKIYITLHTECTKYSILAQSSPPCRPIGA